MPAAEDHRCEFCGHGKSVEDTCGKLHHQQLPNKRVLAAHHKCMQYSSGLKQYDFSHFGGFKTHKVEKEIARGKKLACSWCKKQKAKGKKGRKTGATAGCELKACQKTFHFYCAKLHAVTSRRKSRNNLDVYRVFCSAEHKNKYLESEEGKQEFSCDETDEENNESEEEAEDEKADDSQHSEDRNSVEKDDKNQDAEDAADGADAVNDGDDETTDRNTDDELSDLFMLVSESSSDLDSLPDCITSLSDQGRSSKTLNGKHKSSKAKQENDDEIARKKEKQNWKNRKMVALENVNTVSSDNTLPISDPAKRSKVNPGVSHVASSSDEGSESPVHCTPTRSCSKHTAEKKSQERTYSQKKKKNAMAVMAEEQEHTDSSDSARPLSSLTKKKLCPKLTTDQAKLSSDDEDFELPPLSSPPRSSKKSPGTKCLQQKKKRAMNVMAEEQGFDSPVSIAASGSHSKPVDKKSTLGNSSQKKEKERTTSFERQCVIDDFYRAELPKETNARTSSNDGKNDLGQSKRKPDQSNKISPPSTVTSPAETGTRDVISSQGGGKGQGQRKPGPSHEASPASKLASPTRKGTKDQTSTGGEKETRKGQINGNPGPPHEALPASKLASATRKSTNDEVSSDEEEERHSNGKLSPSCEAPPFSKLASPTRKNANDDTSSDEEEAEKGWHDVKAGSSHESSLPSKQSSPTRKSTNNEMRSGEEEERHSKEKPGSSHEASPPSELASLTKKMTKDQTSFDDEVDEEEEKTELSQSHTLKDKSAFPHTKATSTKKQALPDSKPTSSAKTRSSPDDVWQGIAEEKLSQSKDKTSLPSAQATLTLKCNGEKLSCQSQKLKSKKRRCSSSDSNTERDTSASQKTKVNKSKEAVPDSVDTSSDRSREENTPKSAKAKKRKLDNTGDGFHRDEKRNTSDSKKKKGEKKTQADTSNEEDEQENDHTLSTDLQILPENGNEECPAAREQDHDGSLETVDNFEECVLVIPVGARRFEPKMSDVRKKVAEEFEVTERQVHLWTVVTPVPLPTSCMLYYFCDIADALQRKNWLQLEHLLLDATTIQRKHDEEYIDKASSRRNLPDPQLKDAEVAALVELIIVRLRKACEKNTYLLGMFTDCSGIVYLSLFINSITDPNQNLRSALHQPLAVYHWSPAAVSFAEFDRISPKQRKGYHLQELMVLKHWFTMNLSQLKKIIVLPEEEILKCDMGSTGDDISHLKSRIEEHENSSSHESNLPVVVFIHKINPSIVNFKHYLEAYLKKYAEDFSRQQVICIFHVENLSVKECPEIDLGRTRRDRHVTFFSTFNPAEKPVTFLIADVRDRDNRTVKSTFLGCTRHG